MDDARAVMDEVGSERAVVYGASESGALAYLFAAAHPDHTIALVVHGSSARTAWAPDDPWGVTRERHEQELSLIDRLWGTEQFAREWYTAMSDDPAMMAWEAKLARS